jgi:hypothetical protein
MMHANKQLPDVIPAGLAARLAPDLVEVRARFGCEMQLALVEQLIVAAYQLGAEECPQMTQITADFLKNTKCHNCGGSSVIALGEATFAMPGPDRFRCNSCGHQWEEE